MNLRNNQITIGELLRNPAAKRITMREFGGMLNPMLLNMAKNMTLQQALGYGRGKLTQQRLEQILAELQAI